ASPSWSRSGFACWARCASGSRALAVGAREPARGASLPGGRQPEEQPLQLVDAREVAADVVVAAPLAGRQAEATPCVVVARPGSAQVDDGGQILLLLERGSGAPLAPHRVRDATIQEGGGQLDGVARHDARVEAVEPARRHVVPG